MTDRTPEHPYFSLEHPIRLAHRGSRVLGPENTMNAFSLAVEVLGCRYLEIDVQRTVEGRVVVSHDATLERTTNGTGRVADWSLETLSDLDAAYWFDPEGDYPLRGRGIGIPTLEEVLSAWPNVHVNIDLKAAGIEWQVAEIIMSLERAGSVLIAGFHDRRIRRFRRITRGQVATSAGPRTAAAMYAASRFGRRITAPVQAFQLPVDYRGLRVDRRLVEAVHDSGAHLHVWTVNDRAAMHEYLDLGVDGIVTDRLDTLNEVIQERDDGV